jgi:hypothetical protein
MVKAAAVSDVRPPFNISHFRPSGIIITLSNYGLGFPPLSLSSKEAILEKM